jgi:hypothetical protein
MAWFGQSGTESTSIFTRRTVWAPTGASVQHAVPAGRTVAAWNVDAAVRSRRFDAVTVAVSRRAQDLQDL